MNDFLAFLWALMTFDFMKSRTSTLDAAELQQAWMDGVDEVMSSITYPCHWCEDDVYRVRDKKRNIVWLHAATDKEQGPSLWLDGTHQATPIFSPDPLEAFRDDDPVQDDD